MSWRTIVISQRSKLDYSQGYLVCRGEQVRLNFEDSARMLDEYLDGLIPGDPTNREATSEAFFDFEAASGSVL